MSTANLRGVVLMLAGLSLISCEGRKSSPTAPTPTPVCNPSIAPEAQAFTAPGGTASVTVSVDAGCTWSATAAVSWVGITAGASGVGQGTVAYAVQENAGSDPRSTDLAIAGRRHAVTQAGRPPVQCEYALAPGEATFGKDGGEGVLDVIAPPGCAWTAASTDRWLSVGTPAGTGPGQVRYTVERSTIVEARSGSIAVAGKTFTVRQAGDVGVCQYEVTPVELRPCMPASTLTATLNAPAGCPWTVQSTAPWLGLLVTTSGTGSTPLRFGVSDNYDAPRQGVIEVRWPTATAGQNIHVFQAGCRYAVSVPQFAMPAAGGGGSFEVVQQSDPTSCGGATQDRCVWRAAADVAWIVVTRPGDRAGDDRVDFTILPNAGPDGRTGRIVVRDRVVVVTQAGR